MVKKKFRTQFRPLRHNSWCYIDGGHRDCAGGENLKQFESLDLICGPITYSGLLSAIRSRQGESQGGTFLSAKILGIRPARLWSASDGAEEAAVRYGTANEV